LKKIDEGVNVDRLNDWSIVKRKYFLVSKLHTETPLLSFECKTNLKPELKSELQLILLKYPHSFSLVQYSLQGFIFTLNIQFPTAYPEIECRLNTFSNLVKNVISTCDVTPLFSLKIAKMQNDVSMFLKINLRTYHEGTFTFSNSPRIPPSSDFLKPKSVISLFYICAQQLETVLHCMPSLVPTYYTIVSKKIYCASLKLSANASLILILSTFEGWRFSLKTQTVIYTLIYCLFLLKSISIKHAHVHSDIGYCLNSASSFILPNLTPVASSTDVHLIAIKNNEAYKFRNSIVYSKEKLLNNSGAYVVYFASVDVSSKGLQLNYIMTTL